jgi:hypothetical protein
MNIDWSVKATDILFVFATILGPILAVWASELRQQRKVQLDRKEWVFRTLMSTRGAKLRPEHVSAINHIEFAFPRQECPDIEDARSLYRKQLRNPSSLSEDMAVRDAWNTKANDLFADLLHRMALKLNIPFTKSNITEESYHPDAHFFTELELREIRNLTLQVLRDGRPINIRPITESTAT